MSRKIRNLVFTWNNYPDNHGVLLKDKEKIKFIVYQEERGESGTPHLQGYIELSDRVRFNVLRRWFPWHVEQRKGSQSQAIAYCRKEDTRVGGPYEWGTKRAQGARNDIKSAYEAIKSGESKQSVCENYTTIDAKYFKALDRYRRILGEQSSRTFRRLRVEVLWGDAGTGKTRKAVDSSQSYFILNQPGGSTLWWDGYEGQEHLIIDDFTGWIRYRLLLKILDGYQLRLSIKGGFTYARWTKVTITSNKDPKEWYAVKGMTPELRRRLNEVTHFAGEYNINSSAL